MNEGPNDPHQQIRNIIHKYKDATDLSNEHIELLKEKYAGNIHTTKDEEEVCHVIEELATGTETIEEALDNYTNEQKEIKQEQRDKHMGSSSGTEAHVEKIDIEDAIDEAKLNEEDAALLRRWISESADHDEAKQQEFKWVLNHMTKTGGTFALAQQAYREAREAIDLPTESGLTIEKDGLVRRPDMDKGFEQTQ